MTLAFSRRLALAAGLFLPAIETWRRWGQFGQISKLIATADGQAAWAARWARLLPLAAAHL